MVEKLECQDTVKTSPGPERLSLAVQTGQRDGIYFHKRPRTSLRRAVIDLRIPYDTKQNVQKKKTIMFPYKIRPFYGLKGQEYTQILASVHFCMEIYFLTTALYDERFLMSVSFAFMEIPTRQTTCNRDSKNLNHFQIHGANYKKRNYLVSYAHGRQIRSIILCFANRYWEKNIPKY